MVLLLLPLPRLVQDPIWKNELAAEQVRGYGGD